MQFYITVGITAACGLPVVGSAAMHHVRHSASKHWQSMAEGRIFFPSLPLISKFKEQKTMLSNFRCVLLCILVTIPPNPEVKLMVHGKKKPCGPTASSPASEHPGSMQAFLSSTVPYSPNAGNRRQDKNQDILILGKLGMGFTLHFTALASPCKGGIWHWANPAPMPCPACSWKSGCFVQAHRQAGQGIMILLACFLGSEACFLGSENISQ